MTNVAPSLLSRRVKPVPLKLVPGVKVLGGNVASKGFMKWGLVGL